MWRRMAYIELYREGFDLKAEDVKPGSPVRLKWQVGLSKTWTIDGYLHWDRHEGKTPLDEIYRYDYL